MIVYLLTWLRRRMTVIKIKGSPMFSFYHECFQGAATIRAFGAAKARAASRYLDQLVAARNLSYYYMTGVQQFGAMYVRACVCVQRAMCWRALRDLRRLQASKVKIHDVRAAERDFESAHARYNVTSTVFAVVFPCCM